jgi:hypothetical protein
MPASARRRAVLRFLIGEGQILADRHFVTVSRKTETPVDRGS